jgi:pseudo-response regulator 7
LSNAPRILSNLSPSLSVIPAENGLHAWQHLEDLQSNIDLLLTEVAMPCLSGIGLLRKIMSHKICKDIPVISK